MGEPLLSMAHVFYACDGRAALQTLNFISAERSVDWIAKKAWRFIFRSSKAEWRADLGKKMSLFCVSGDSRSYLSTQLFCWNEGLSVPLSSFQNLLPVFTFLTSLNNTIFFYF